MPHPRPLRTKPPMTADEARAFVARMKAETSKASQIKLLRMALEGFGNLTPDAMVVYAERLEELAPRPYRPRHDQTIADAQ